MRLLATFLEKVAPKHLAPDTERAAWSRSDAGRKLAQLRGLGQYGQYMSSELNQDCLPLGS